MSIRLIKSLRKQSIRVELVNIVFQAVIISRISTLSQHGAAVYVLSGNLKFIFFCLYLIAHAFAITRTFDSQLFATDQTLFKSTGYTDHCLHSVLL